MREKRARRLAWSAFFLWVLFLAGAFALAVASKPGYPGSGDGGGPGFAVITASFPIVAILILSRQPRNVIGWILMAIGIGWAVPVADYGAFALSRDLPGGAVAISLGAPTWAPPIILMGTSLLLRFPDGTLLSPRWRRVEWVAAFATVATVLTILFSPGDLADSGYPHLTNPLGIEALRPILNLVIALILLIPATIVASAVSLVMRFRRSSGTERLQLKWLTTAGAILAAIYLVAMIVSINTSWGLSNTPGWVAVIQNAAVLSFLLIPVSIGFAVLKYRLYDIDVVINKTLVYGSMAAFITAVYVAIVVGIGHAIGSDRNLGLSVMATALVAVAFQPVRDRVKRLANRLVYGKRATPYEVLSEFSGGMAHAVATEELLPRMARIAAEGTGASRVDVWLHIGSELVREASWPQGNGRMRSAVPLGESDDPIAVPGADTAIPVRHHGELLGVIGVKKTRGEAVTPAEAKLLEDLASQAGLVLRNVRLIEELRTSRQRLVTAQDEERRRLERNLHDGAQQRLVAIALALRMARALVRSDSTPALGERLDMASDQLRQALSELREFARGIHPAILTERGLAPALESLAERSPVPATVESTLRMRLPGPVEVTAYFVVSEALANAGKYSKATAVTISVEAVNGLLKLEVADDGIGGADASRGSGLRGLADRVAVVDGMLEVDSPPGEGTRLRCRIPVAGGSSDGERVLVAATAGPAAGPG
jgi:signal transduction histidine kinase